MTNQEPEEDVLDRLNRLHAPLKHRRNRGKSEPALKAMSTTRERAKKGQLNLKAEKRLEAR